jgi:vacuolar protein-sorting-associated protein 4
MTDCNFRDKAVEIVREATEADRRKDYPEAFRLYNLALKYFMNALK